MLTIIVSIACMPFSSIQGRQGKGTIFMFSTGNGGEMGDSCAADGYSSSIYTIGIGAANSNGEQAPYDEQCAGKMAVAFVDITSRFQHVVCICNERA